MGMPGILIAIDGIDGAGKTTQVARLAETLTALGEHVVTSKEPTNGVHGRRIRASATAGRLPLDDELELFIQDRREHIERFIRPALERGLTVILDRYFYSTIAYQGFRGGDMRVIEHRVRGEALAPDAAVLLDIEPALSQARIRQRDGVGNTFEDPAELREIRKLFLEIARSDAGVTVVDGGGTADEVETELLATLLGGPMYAKRCAKTYGCTDHYHCSFRMTDTCPWWRVRDGLYERLVRTHPELLDRALLQA